MANVDRANGFRPVKSLLGAPWTSLVRTYPASDTGRPAGDAGTLYIGSVVKLDAGGNVIPADTTDAVLGVVVATGTNNSVTALNTDNNHRYFNPDNLSKRCLEPTEAGYVGVVPAEGCLFSVQSSGTDHVQGSDCAFGVNTGNVTTGNSAVVVSTAGTPAAADVVVVEHDTRPDNDASEANARYIVKFVRHVNSIGRTYS